MTVYKYTFVDFKLMLKYVLCTFYNRREAAYIKRNVKEREIYLGEKRLFLDYNVINKNKYCIMYVQQFYKES